MKTVLTKIIPPQQRHLLSRPRLLEKVDLCRNFRLTLIHASTGFGKTSLLADYARTTDLALAWYAMDEKDGDPAEFCRYLLNSLRVAYPKFGINYENVLEQNLKDLHKTEVLVRLAEEYVADLENLRAVPDHKFRPTLIVLDDYQFAEGPSLNAFIQRALEIWPSDFHLLIASRFLPEGLRLSRLIAKQMLSQITTSELAFTAAEVNQLLNEFYAVDDPELAANLAEYSEGWITAVVLAMSSRNLSRTAQWETLRTALQSGGGGEQIFEYLAQEVLDTLSNELQDFLFKTSVFNFMTVDFCNELVGSEAAEEFLRYLENRNLFINRIPDDEETYFQYHSLFRQFLLARLKRNKVSYRATELRAAQLLEAHGKSEQQVEAVYHYLAAGAVTQAAELLDRIAESLFQTGRINLLVELFASVPSEAESRLANLLNVKAELLFRQGQNEAALTAYEETERLYRREDKFDRAARTVAQQAQILIRLGQRREATAKCLQVLVDEVKLLESLDGRVAVAIVHHMLGFIAIEEGNNIKAEAELKAASLLYKLLNDKYRLAALDSYFAQLYEREGRLVKSSIFYERALAFFIQTGNRISEAYCRCGLANNFYLQGNLQSSEKQLNQIVELIQHSDERYLQLFIQSYLANIYRDTMRYDKAQNMYSASLNLARANGVRKMEISLINDQAICFVLQSCFEEAQILLQQALVLADEYELAERTAMTYLHQGWLNYISKAYKRALAAVTKAIEVVTKSNMPGELVRSKLAQATILLAMGEPRRAMTELNDCLEKNADLNHEPFLKFELEWASPLFQYAATKKNKEVVDDFLRKHNFINASLQPEVALAAPQNAHPSHPTLLYLNNSAAVSNNEPAPNAVLQVYGFNGGRVWLGDSEIKQWRTTKSREALFFLLEKTSCTRDELVEALWPDEDETNAQNLLHVTFSHLRKAIAPVLLKLNAGRYSLQGPIWYDAAEFSLEVRMAISGKASDTPRLATALELYKRDFLDQLYSDWSVQRQQELLQLYINGLEKLARAYEGQDQTVMALTVWQQLLIKDPYNEDAHRATIKCFLALDRKLEAKRQWHQLVKALEELDLEPSTQSSQLLQLLA